MTDTPIASCLPTPGPWDYNEVGLVYGQGPGDSDGAPFVCDACLDCSMGMSPEEEANARLIAAAPELLATLEQAVAALNTAPRFRVPSLDTDSYKIAALCDRVIAKAKGGAQ